ncbi:hypothetical protein DFJ58DRAFT_915925 [Suillus subalutaceus]|uniref:uncharacterized protein n=1 Tax=Suillus subalutaceus TaxID=48586 RepID=UPI001B86DBCA|nr:uncharacterized protein DFJ58DRAFT_915925 [Suillus subalutaceus]KAG1843574.1 hypothetical protein DFJ58DRAFT_915925 [Suillus subalutaceus]
MPSMPPANPLNSQHGGICGILFRVCASTNVSDPVIAAVALAHDRGLYQPTRYETQRDAKLKFADAVSFRWFNNVGVPRWLRFARTPYPSHEPWLTSLGITFALLKEYPQGHILHKENGNDQLQLNIQYGICLVKPPDHCCLIDALFKCSHGPPPQLPKRYNSILASHPMDSSVIIRRVGPGGLRGLAESPFVLEDVLNKTKAGYAAAILVLDIDMIKYSSYQIGLYQTWVGNHQGGGNDRNRVGTRHRGGWRESRSTIGVTSGPRDDTRGNIGRVGAEGSENYHGKDDGGHTEHHPHHEGREQAREDSDCSDEQGGRSIEDGYTHKLFGVGSVPYNSRRLPGVAGGSSQTNAIFVKLITAFQLGLITQPNSTKLLRHHIFLNSSAVYSPVPGVTEGSDSRVYLRGDPSFYVQRITVMLSQVGMSYHETGGCRDRFSKFVPAQSAMIHHVSCVIEEIGKSED